MPPQFNNKKNKSNSPPNTLYAPIGKLLDLFKVFQDILLHGQLIFRQAFDVDNISYEGTDSFIHKNIKIKYSADLEIRRSVRKSFGIYIKPGHFRGMIISF